MQGPAADSLPALYCLDAVISAAVTAADGSIRIKTFPIQDFITGPGKIITGGSIACNRHKFSDS